MKEKIPEKFLEFEVDFRPYDKKVVLTLKEVCHYRDEKWPRVPKVVTIEEISLINCFGIPKSELTVRAQLNRLKERVMRKYMQNERLIRPLESAVYDETEGRYYLRTHATTQFIERLK